MGVGLVFGEVAGVSEVFVTSGSGADPDGYVGVFDLHLGGWACAAELGSQAVRFPSWSVLMVAVGTNCLQILAMS